jgi:hypothetical protein
MKLVAPRELDTIVYEDIYSFEQIQARPNHWWHPMKSLQQQLNFETGEFFIYSIFILCEQLNGVYKASL